MKKKKNEKIKKLYLKIKALFKNCPNPWKVATYAFKNKKKIGYNQYMPLERIAYLSVSSFIRHNHLNYDQLLLEGIPRNEARFLLTDELKSKINEWKNKR